MPLLPSYFLAAVRNSPDAAALRSSRRSLTYRETADVMNHLAERLIVEGLRTGERVVILAKDPIDVILGMMGVIRAGGIAVPLPHPLDFSAIESIAKHCAPFCILTTKDDLLHFPLLRDRLSCQFAFLEDAGGTQSDASAREGMLRVFDDAGEIDRISALMNLSESTEVLLLYDFMNSARLNGSVFNHENIFRGLDILRNGDSAYQGESALVLHSVASISGILTIFHFLFRGDTVLVPQSERISGTTAKGITPKEYHALSIGASALGGYLQAVSIREAPGAREIRTIDVHGTAIPRYQKNLLLSMFPLASIVVWYGTSEAPLCARLDLRAEPDKLDTLGKPPSGVVISVREGAQFKGHAGEISVRGSHLMLRRWEPRTSGESPENDNGVIRTGDFGSLDRDGYLHFLGGIDDMLHLAGETVSPFEVEEKIREVYMGCELCVVGLPDPLEPGREVAVLCYTSDGSKTIIPSELSSALADRLKKDEIPKIVYRLEKFPGSGGAINRKELRRVILEGASPHHHDSADR